MSNRVSPSACGRSGRGIRPWPAWKSLQTRERFRPGYPGILGKGGAFEAGDVAMSAWSPFPPSVVEKATRHKTYKAPAPQLTGCSIRPLSREFLGGKAGEQTTKQTTDAGSPGMGETCGGAQPAPLLITAVRPSSREGASFPRRDDYNGGPIPLPSFEMPSWGAGIVPQTIEPAPLFHCDNQSRHVPAGECPRRGFFVSRGGRDG
jgi:hypothetical protein